MACWSRLAGSGLSPEEQHGLLPSPYPFSLRLLAGKKAAAKGRQRQASRGVHTLYLPSPLVSIKEAEASSSQRSPLHTLFCVPDTLSQFPLPEQGSPSFLCCKHQSKVAKFKKNKKHPKCVLEKKCYGLQGVQRRGVGAPGQKLGEQCISHRGMPTFPSPKTEHSI